MFRGKGLYRHQLAFEAIGPKRTGSALRVHSRVGHGNEGS